MCLILETWWYFKCSRDLFHKIYSSGNPYLMKNCVYDWVLCVYDLYKLEHALVCCCTMCKIFSDIFILLLEITVKFCFPKSWQELVKQVPRSDAGPCINTAICLYPNPFSQWQCSVQWKLHYLVNSSPLGQNSRHFADDILRRIFVNEKFCILIEISLPNGPMDNKPALV